MRGTMANNASRLDLGAPKLGPNDVDQADESIGKPCADLHPRQRSRFDGLELFGSIDNLSDRDPPANLRLSGNPVYFDPVGRRFKLGLRATW